MTRYSIPIKFGVFAAVMVVIFAGLVVVFSKATFASTTTYHAVFTSSSGMQSGSSVRIAGAPVGSVTAVDRGRDNLAHVTFDLQSKYPLTTGTRALIRYENLVGDRYLELTDGPGMSDALQGGDTIPLDRTEPALDLDLLLGGVKPLLRGLEPDHVNSLSEALVQVFQGQGDALVTLLGSTGSLTTELAAREDVIGEVVDNLNEVLGTLDGKREQFSATVDGLQRLVSGLAADRDPIGDALPRIADATGGLADLLQVARPDIRAAIDRTGALAANLDAGSESIEATLTGLPDIYRRLARTGSYGSFFQFYICSASLRFTAPDNQTMKVKMPGSSTEGRCAP
ncbi:MCE family protein [Rhodococcus gannanensis]|uniref:MCE family protein n=1 Tax=Rhodococcus gannanensis TaxID=1960308 RepID=A0ABW4P4Z7_9NOCA